MESSLAVALVVVARWYEGGGTPPVIVGAVFSLAY